MTDKLVRPPVHIPLDASNFMEKFTEAWEEHVEGFSQMKGRASGSSAGALSGRGSGGKARRGNAKGKGISDSSLDHLPEWKRRLILKKQRDMSQRNDRKASVNSVEDVRARVQEAYRQLKKGRSSASRCDSQDVKNSKAALPHTRKRKKKGSKETR